jgi:hypothetical protein
MGIRIRGVPGESLNLLITVLLPAWRKFRFGSPIEARPLRLRRQPYAAAAVCLAFSSSFLCRAPALYNPACGFRAGEVQVFEPVLRLAVRPVVSPCGLCYSGHGSGDTPLIERALRSVGGVQK